MVNSSCVFNRNMYYFSLELVDLGLDSLEIGSLDLSDLSSVLVELESWHAANAAGFSGFGILINIDLHEDTGAFKLGGELSKFWGDLLAWWAPGGGEVNNDKLAGVSGEGGIELSLIFKHLDHLRGNICFFKI